MSSPHTANFLAAARSTSAAMATLVQIDVTLPGAVSFHLSDKEVLTPDGQFWQACLIDANPIQAKTSWLDFKVQPASCSVKLANVKISEDAAANAVATCAANDMTGAVVTIWLWEQTLASASDKAQVFKGTIAQVEYDATGVWFHCIQRRNWNRVMNRMLNLEDYPRLPLGNRGRYLPVFFGDKAAIGMRAPWTSAYGNKPDQEKAGAGLGVIPGIITDTRQTIVAYFDREAVANMYDTTAGYNQFLLAGDKLAVVDSGAITERRGFSYFSGTDSEVIIGNDTLFTYYGALPVTERTVATGAVFSSAGNPMNACDPYDETSFATIDGGASKFKLQLVLPNASALGLISSVTVAVAASGDAGNTHHLRVYPINPATGANGAIVQTGGNFTTTTPTLLTGTWDASTYAADRWNFGGDGSTFWDIAVDVGGGGTDKASIYWAVLIVKYRTQGNLVEPASYQNVPANPKARTPAGYTPPHPARFALGGDLQFFANLRGMDDNNAGFGGVFTGSSSNLISKAADIAAAILCLYGGEAYASLETGASTFGSFVKARDWLRGASDQDFVLAPYFGDKTFVVDGVEKVTSQALALPFIDRTDDKWKLVVWRTDAQVDYDLALDSTHFLTSPRFLSAGDVPVVYAVRIAWFQDWRLNKPMFTATVGPTESTRGYTQPNWHDQRLIVDSTDNKLDWKSGASTFNDTLASATYTPMGLASQIRTQMRTHVAQVHVGWGLSIVAGYNDALDVTITATPYHATVAPGAYGPEALSLAIAAALNAAQTARVFSCSYSYSTNKFTVSATGGTFDVLPDTGTNQLTSAWYVLGIDDDATGVTTTTGNFARYAERFWANRGSSASQLTFLFGTGANAGSSCGTLIGNSSGDQGAANDLTMAYRRCDRETQAATLLNTRWRSKQKEDDQTADAIHNENVAILYRDRLFDLESQPPPSVTFPTFAMPDLQLGRIFQMTNDVDNLVGYGREGSDGSWAGKKFQAMEVSQYIVTAYHQEVTAVELVQN